MRALGYVRVSTTDQADNGYGLAAQETAIGQATDRKGWQLDHVYRDEGWTAASLERPALRKALERIADGSADALIVAKLDRLSRSTSDFARLMEWFSAAQAHIVALDMEVDTSTPNGELMAHIMAAFANWERQVISQRTRDGLAEARRQGKRISRPAVSDDPELVRTIEDLKACGLSLRAICEELTLQGWPTLRGGAVWRPNALVTVLGSGRRRVLAPRRLVELPEIRRRG